MADEDNYRSQFDRFAQDEYLKILLRTDPDAVIPMLFLDLMNQVNLIQGQAGLTLTELAQSAESGQPVDREFTENVTLKILNGAVDMSNVLKALMEYYEITHRSTDDE